MIGEVEQLYWEDIQVNNDRFTMILIQRGGSNSTPKDKNERFVPVHPKIAKLLGLVRKRTGLIFKNITERKLLKQLKILCEKCDFESPRQYKLHSFRHDFASICANHHVAYRKALTWLGHSSSEMLELYYHLHDDDSQKAMLALANSGIIGCCFSGKNLTFEGNGAVKTRENVTSS